MRDKSNDLRYVKRHFVDLNVVELCRQRQRNQTRNEREDNGRR